MPFLYILSGSLSGQSFEIKEDEVTIGRSSENTITVDDPAVSSHHCTVLREKMGFRINDAASTNGTFLNGKRIEEAALSPGDTITLGSVNIELRDLSNEKPRQPQPKPPATTRISLQPGSTKVGAPPAAFGAKKDTRWVWISIILVLAAMAIAAGVWFVLKLTGGE